MADFEQIGPYRVLQQLGEGGMGIVHLALDERGRAVAVKVLRPHVANDEDARARLAREVDTLSRVRSKRIAPVFDADLDAEPPYIVTRYVPGPSLEQYVKENGPLDAKQLLALAQGLAEALRAIHDVGVIHRDLKPGNVLMLDGEPVVIDFGIAHIADTSRMTMTGLVMGTPGYLSPELVEGGQVTPATDWWGWAATLVFASTGRSPFGRGGMEAILSRVARGEADLRDVDPDLAPLLHAALTPDPELRPDADEVLAALEARAHGRPVTDVLPQRTRSLERDDTRRLPVQPPAPAASEPPPPWGSGAWQDPNPQPAPVAPAPVAPAPPPADGRQPWPGVAGGYPDRPGDPRIGLPQRSDVLFGLLVALVALTAFAPVVGVVVVLAWSLLARTVDTSMTATVRRRHRRGYRRSDAPVAVAASPVHLLAALVATVATAILPLLVGAAGVLATAVALGSSSGGEVDLDAPTPIAVGALLAVLMGWWGPGGPSLRRGSRSLVRSVTGLTPVRIVLVVVLVVVGLAVLGGLATDALDIDWWPLLESPLPEPQQLPGL